MVDNQNIEHPVLQLFDAGFTGIIPVIPPDAPEDKALTGVALGKTPGIRRQDGSWKPFSWKEVVARRQDVYKWIEQGANFGLRTADYRFIDIDVEDPALVDAFVVGIERVAGVPLLRRIGRAPRVAIPFRASGPLKRIVCPLIDASRQKLGAVEILADGQQAVIHGIHPKTRAPYYWCFGVTAGDVTLLASRRPSDIPRLTHDLLERILEELVRVATDHGLLLVRAKTSVEQTPAGPDQQSLRAPSVERLREAVESIPNAEGFEDRAAYITMLHAIRAAAGPTHVADGLEIACEWAARWRDGFNDPTTVRRDFDGCNSSEYRVGWEWLAARARAHGFVDAVDDFDALEASEELPPHISQFNARYAKVRSVANMVLETPPEGGFRYMPARHWESIEMNFQVPVGSGRGLKLKPATALWMTHPARRTYDDIVFDPSLPPLSGVPSPSARENFNTWPGLATAPSAEGTCALFLEHVEEIVCDGDEDANKWVMMWLAAMVQQPDRLPGTALVLGGVQGAGKSLVGQTMGRILGDKLYTTVSGPAELTGRFNADLEGKILIQVEEAFYAGDKKMLGRLKDMITNPRTRIERKGIDPFTIANYARLLITSNESWIVPAGEGERRFMMLQVSSARARDRSYFGALLEQMNDGGYRRLLHHLLHEVQIDWDFISQPIATDALRDQQIQTLSIAKRWLYLLLDGASLPGDGSGSGVTSCDMLFNNFRTYMQGVGAIRGADNLTLGRLLASYGIEKPRCRVEGAREYRYAFPPLPEIRSAFSRDLATSPEWDITENWRPEDSALSPV